MPKNKQKASRRSNNSKNVQYTVGRPTKNGRGSVAFTSSLADVQHVHSLVNPFSPSARGSKLPDSDSSKSVAISLVQKFTPDTDSGGNFVRFIQPSLIDTYVPTTLLGHSVTATSAAVSIADYAAVAASFSTYRIVSWGVKIYSTLAPTAQSGYFTMITDPKFAVGADGDSSFYEETLSYPTSEKTVQWVSKPMGNSYLDYHAIATPVLPWDSLMIMGVGLPATTSDVFIVEVFFNIECQVALGALTSAIATPAAAHKPHILAAVADVHKRSSGSKVASAVKAGFIGWIKGALSRGATMARNAISNYASSMSGGTLPPLQLTDYSHVPMVD